MEREAKQRFLKKIAINGFSIEEREQQLVLRPRGMEAVAELVIEETEGGWKVTGASGRYAGFKRGRKKEYLENYLNIWATQAEAES